MNPTKSNTIISWVFLIILALIWGSSFILIKKGLVHLSPQEVGSLRIVAASLFLAPVALLRLKRVKFRDWKYLVSLGFLGSLVPSFLFATAQTVLPSSLTGVLNALTPISTILVGILFYGQKHKFRVFNGIAIGFVGTAILITGGEGGTFTFNAYALLIVLATIFYATNLNLIKFHLAHLKALTITSISLIGVGVIATVHLFVFTDFASKLSGNNDVLLSISFIVLLGILGTAIALVIFNKIVHLTNPIFASSVTYIIPVVAVIWGLWDGEELFVVHYLGMILIVLGVFIANRRA